MADKHDTSDRDSADGIPQARTPEQAADQQPEAVNGADVKESEDAGEPEPAPSASDGGTESPPEGSSGQRPRPTKRAAKQATKAATRPPTRASGKTTGKGDKAATRKAAKTDGKVDGKAARKAEGGAGQEVAPVEAPALAAALPSSAPSADGPSPLPATAIPGAWWEAAWEALRHPGQPPRRLAELAVAELGPRAAAWAAWLRRTYPDPPAYGIMRLAVQEATRAGWALALTEAGGPVMAPARLVGIAWVRATLVLRVAAAYGYDPTAPQRVDDLIEVFQLDPEADGEAVSLARVGGGAGQLGLVRTAVTRFTLRKGLGAQAVRALFVASDHTDQLTKLAHRAARRYRPGRPASTEASSASTSSRNKL